MKRMRSLFVAMIVGAGILAACTVAPIQRPTPAADATPAITAEISDPPATADGVIRENMRGLLARQLQVARESVEVVAAAPTEWPDACLGAGAPAESCAQVVTPGYVVTLRVDGQEYTYHTDPGGYVTRLVAGPEPQIGAPILTWTGTVDNGSCQEALIGADGVAFGLCGGAPKLGGKFVSAARLDALRTWAEKFAAFEATTDLGTVSFAGTGPAVATPAEQRQIAQWAQMVTMEAAGGESLAGLRWQGPAEPGSPDTSQCAVMQIGGGEVGLGACDGAMSTLPLDGGLEAQWAEIEARFAPFVYETPTETLVFAGMGTAAGEAWQRALLAWARQRHAELSSGKVSAAAGTAMSWHLGSLPAQTELCRHLTVLGYGYAQAETRPCAGGEVVESADGWLETAELEWLDPWLYERAALYAGDNYIAGMGSQPMSEAEAAEAEQWAAEVWNRLYSLFFTSLGGATPLEPFSQGILDSFRFLEETVATADGG